MHHSIVTFIAYSHRRRSTCFGHYRAHHQELFQTAVAASDHLRINPATGGCDCSLKELLMMGTIVPETR
jgi:hypothetical protein